MYVHGVAWCIYILVDVCMYLVLPGVYIYTSRCMYAPGVAWCIYILADVCMYMVLPGVYIY